MSAISIGPEYYWGEADYARHVTVRGNTLSENVLNGSAAGTIFLHGDGAIGNADITIADNLFDRNYGQTAIHVAYTDGVRIATNRFITSPLPLPDKARTILHVETSRNITLNESQHRGKPAAQDTLVSLGKNVEALTGNDTSGHPQHWYGRCWELIEKYDPDMFNNDAPYPDEKEGKSLGVKLFTAYINRDVKENGGRQTVVFSCKDGKRDRAAFTYNLERGSSAEIQPQPWMWATDLSGGWFYRKDAVNRMSIPVMIGNAVDAISKNGVVMLNVALRGDGTLPENQAAYLATFGEFLKTCGEGIYGSRAWTICGEGPLKMKDGRQGENHTDFTQEDIRFTTKDGNLYAFVLAPPTKDIVIKALAAGGLLKNELESIALLGSSETVKWSRSPDGLAIKRPETLPCKHVIGFRITLK
jgi:hypothetical protein